MDWDDLSPIEAPKTSIKRGTSLLQLGSLKEQTNNNNILNFSKNTDSNFDLPPIFPDESSEKHVTISASSNESQSETAPSSPRPSRLLLSGVLNRSNSTETIETKQIIHPIIQESPNPQVDDLFESSQTILPPRKTRLNLFSSKSDESFDSSKKDEKEPISILKKGSLFNAPLNKIIESDKSTIENDHNEQNTKIFDESSTTTFSSQSESNQILNIPRLQRRNSLLGDLTNHPSESALGSAPAPIRKQNSFLSLGNESSEANSQPFLPEIKTENVPKTPCDIVEHSLLSCIDRVFVSFKRTVNRDISHSIKANDPINPITFDNFINDLVDEVKETIEQNDDNNKKELDINSINNNLINIFEDNFRPIRRLFSDSEQRKIQFRDRKKEELQQMDVNIKDILNTISSFSSKSIKELDKIKEKVLIKREERESINRMNQRKIRSLQMRFNEYQNRINQQDLELESIERMLRHTENLEREFENSIKQKHDLTQEKIMKEIDTITNSLMRRDQTEFVDVYSNISKHLTDINLSIQDDLTELLKKETLINPVNSPFTRNISNYPLKFMTASERINENRKFRENSKREFEERQKLQENESFENSFIY